MSFLPIVIYPDPRLREKLPPAKNVTKEIKQLLANMAETMYSASGIGLAANQVGASVRAIVVDIQESDDPAQRASQLYKIVNPKIVMREGKIRTEEGCLSIPEVREFVSRASRVIVEGLDEEGQAIKIEASGLLSVCLQHEIDHLDGVLFIDHLSRLKKQLIKTKLEKLVANQDRE